LANSFLGDLSGQIHDINPGMGPRVGNFDTGNGYGTRVFWIAKVPDSDLTVNLAAGTAELKVAGIPEYDYNGFLDSDSTDWNYDYSAAHPHGFYNATLDFDIKWNGPVTETDTVKDTANGFAGTFYQNDATVSWNVSSQRPAGTGHFTFTGDPSNSANSNTIVAGTAFNQLAAEKNGVFFPSGASLQPDPVNPALTDLVVDGSSNGGVHIQVQGVHDGDAVRVRIDGAGQAYQADFPTALITRLIVHSGPGDNHIEVTPNVKLPAILMGDYGNDHIEAGAGPTVLAGGDGNDHLEGGLAGDILIGGNGNDHLEAHGGSDLLVGDATIYDNDVSALIGLLNRWSGDDSYSNRVADLSTSLNNSTVTDDGAVDLLEGGSGMDWYIVDANDKIKGRKPGEIVTMIG
jgi:hypothetical protein